MDYRSIQNRMNAEDALVLAIRNGVFAGKDGTWSINGKSGRYVVGAKSLFEGEHIKDFKNAMVSIGSAVGSGRYDAIGLWRDTESGVYYVDANLYFEDLDEALEFGRSRGEIAIYDIEDDKEIRC